MKQSNTTIGTFITEVEQKRSNNLLKLNKTHRANLFLLNQLKRCYYRVRNDKKRTSSAQLSEGSPAC